MGFCFMVIKNERLDQIKTKCLDQIKMEGFSLCVFLDLYRCLDSLCIS